MLSEQTEESIALHSAESRTSVEEEALQEIQNELLHKAIAELPDIQRHRLTLYYFDEMTYEEIAANEGCTKMAIKLSVDRAIAQLKKKIKNF